MKDLAAIEKRMAEISAKDLKVSPRVLPRDEAGGPLKENRRATTRPNHQRHSAGEVDQPVRTGDWETCAADRTYPSTGKLKGIKLTKVAGAYWRGEFANEMLLA